MRKPLAPPPFSELFKSITPGKWANANLPPASSGKYLHWDEIVHRMPPEGLTHEDWWASLKFGRMLNYRSLPEFRACDGKPFVYLITDKIFEELHKIDMGGGGHIGIAEPITNPETQKQYYMSSLMEEAITSSQLEGASTTRHIAKELLQTGRPPQDRDERMILNNFQAMERINDLKDASLTPDLIFELHRLITDQVMDDPTAVGRFRRREDEIVVLDGENNVLHTPPSADELQARFAAMCDFGNGKTPGYFLHPVIRSIILHFWLAYDHPFADGNGRTARALFYWSMLHHKFWLCQYISISRTLRKAPIQYARSFLYTETDDNDLTYFILYQIDVLRQAFNDLNLYIEKTTSRVQELENRLQGMGSLNHRQRALISHATRHPRFRYTIESHRQSHAVAYGTARSDLLQLAEKGLFSANKMGKTWYFTPLPEMEQRLGSLPV